MAKKIRSFEQLEEELKKSILTANKRISNEPVKDLKNSVQKVVYDSYKPNRKTGYRRTKQLKNSITKEVTQEGTKTSIRVYHDISKMDEIPPNGSYRYGTHHSTVSEYIPQKYAYYLPATIEDGTSGDIFGKGPWTKPRRYFAPVKERWNEEYKDILKGALKKGGLDVRG